MDGDFKLNTYVKIYGPPLLEAIDSLQTIALGMSNVKHFHLFSPHANVMDPSSLAHPSSSTYETTLEDAEALTTSPMEEGMEPTTHPSISKSGHNLGEYDFFFEWAEDPSWEQMRELISKIDKALTPLGCKYTLVSK